MTNIVSYDSVKPCVISWTPLSMNWWILVCISSLFNFQKRQCLFSLTPCSDFSVIHSASNPVGARGSSPGIQAGETWSWQLTFIYSQH